MKGSTGEGEKGGNSDREDMEFLPQRTRRSTERNRRREKEKGDNGTRIFADERRLGNYGEHEEGFRREKVVY